MLKLKRKKQVFTESKNGLIWNHWSLTGPTSLLKQRKILIGFSIDAKVKLQMPAHQVLSSTYNTVVQLADFCLVFLHNRPQVFFFWKVISRFFFSWRSIGSFLAYSILPYVYLEWNFFFLLLMRNVRRASIFSCYLLHSNCCW